MDTTRYYLGILLVISVPPAILFWLLIHPFAGFWRNRFGAEYEEYRARVPAFIPRIGSKPIE